MGADLIVTVPSVVVDEPWEMIGDDVPPYSRPRDRLLCAITVDGCPVHLEAIRVTFDEFDRRQHACDDRFDELLDHGYAICGDAPFQTARIAVDGKLGDYVILATSFGA